MNSGTFETIDRRQSIATADARTSQGAATKPSWAVHFGRLLGGFAVLFLAMDAAMKIFRLPEAVETTVQLGYPDGVIVPLGVLEILLLAIYLVPRTALLGAILWTGYLGGAIATHVRVENPLFSHIVFPVYVAAFLWASLCLRDGRVARALGFRSGQ